MLDPTIKRMYLRLCSTLNTPRSLACYILASYGEWGQLVSMRVDPSLFCDQHQSIDRFRRDTLATEFLRKLEGLPTGIDLEAAAVDSFFEAERMNLLTEVRLDRYLSSMCLTTPLEWKYYEIVRDAQAFLAKALGPLPKQLNGRFGKGATFESKTWRHRAITAYDKLRNYPTCTPACSGLSDHLVWETALAYAYGGIGANRTFEVVPGNRFTTVPKDSTKHRGIAIEPGLNVFGQLALGDYLSGRLSRIGLSKEKGEQTHRRMAEHASRTGSHATIDLSSASDTVCTSLVRLLLPPEWYDLLCIFRSEKTFMSRHGWVYLRKFSSMGNGYTFELETLIFAALAHACGGKVGVDTFVYGDDIIVPTIISRQLLAALRYSGFKPNERKTFVDGYFRESCGGDFLKGYDVRAIYLKETPHETSDWIVLANQLYDLAERWLMPELLPIREAVLDNVPSEIRRCRGPKALGDILIWDEPRKWSYRVRASRRYFRVWRPVQKRNFLHGKHKLFFDETTGVYTRWIEMKEQGIALAAAILGLPSTGIAPRKAVTGYRFGRVSYS